MRPGTLLRWYALKPIFKSEIKDDLIVLDIGSYDGSISSNLKKLFSNLKITIVDMDKSGLQLAKEKGLNTLYASATELPLENSSVDVVLCLDLIEHVKEDDKVIKEISRVLKEGGKIILTTPMQNGVSFPFLSKQKIEAINKSWGHVRKGYSLKNIEKLFKENKLAIIKRDKYFNFLTRFAYRFSFLSGMSLKGKSLLYQIIVKLDPLTKYGSQEHIIIAKKVKLWK